MSKPPSLSGRDAGLALLVVTIWGVNFAIIDEGLDHVPPLLFAALRFTCVALCCLIVPRPKVAWYWLLLVGLFTGTGQYAFSYIGLSEGVPSGLTALVMQAQVPLTIIFAGIALREVPGLRRSLGILLSAAGLVIVAIARGGTVPIVALLFIVAAAASWAVGNVSTRMAHPDNGFRLVIWSSLVPPIPLFLLSLVREGWSRDATAVAHAGITPWLSLAFTVLLATILAMGLWSSLLGRYRADQVVSFALLIPVIGLLTGWLTQGEHISAAVLAGTFVVLLGLALTTIPGLLTRKDQSREAVADATEQTANPSAATTVSTDEQ